MLTFKFKTFYLFTLLIWTQTAFGQLSQSIRIEKGTYLTSEAIQVVAEQGVPIAYSADKLPNASCSFNRSKMTVGEFFEKLARETGISYRTLSGTVLVSFTPAAKRIIRGTVRDAKTGEALSGATVSKSGTLTGVISNVYGYYSFQLPSSLQIIEVSFLGYQTATDTLDLRYKGQIKDFFLHPKIENLNEVVVTGKPPNHNISSPIPGINTVNLNTEGQIPYFLGEVDVLQGATLLPGIKTLGEDANGLNIRGGAVDQNLILLDEATVYNPNHLNGLISVFNPEMVNSFEIMKGFIPPSYGGRASSVITIHQKEGNNQEYHFTGGIGLVSARFIVEGPIKREISSFIVSGRQSLFDVSLDDNTRTNFQDINAKVNWKPNNKNTFFFSGYFGNDRNTNRFETVRNWGNRNFSLRWNHLFGKRVFTNLSAIFSEYNYRVTQPQESASFIGQSRIIDYSLKTDWGYVINPSNELNFGASTILHRLKPGDRIPFDESLSSSNPLFLDTEHGIESALYISHQLKYRKFLLLYGLRGSLMSNLGPGEVLEYEANTTRSNQSIADTLNYGLGESIKTYFGLEPRASLVYQFTADKSIKASYTRSYQYLHLISNTITPAPTDIWKLSDTYIKPTISTHYSLGYYQNFANNQWEAYIDGYFKLLFNSIEYKDGADLLFNPNPETELLNGLGRSYGLEFFLKKNSGKWTGWLSYTLSRSEVKVNGQNPEERINGGQYYATNFDKTHDASVVGIYRIFPRLSSSFSFNFTSGRPFTLPAGRYFYEGNLVPHFTERNQSRLPSYHRLDVSLKWSGKKNKKNGETRKIEDYWTLVIYNLYGRDNVYSYFYREDEQTGSTLLEPYTIFDSIIPAITYHLRF